MRYTRLSTYDLTKGDFNELTGIAEKGILPTFVKEPGFINFGLVDAGDHKVVSISIWETREAAQRSAGMAASWVKENIADRVHLVTTYIGDLALYRGIGPHDHLRIVDRPYEVPVSRLHALQRLADDAVGVIDELLHRSSSSVGGSRERIARHM